MNNNYDIFISYKRNDKEKVFAIKDYIEKNTGVSCWIDLDGIESDAQFANVIIKAINNAKVFLFMYSASHLEIEDVDNDWTVREINFAQQKKKRIVFINIDGTPLTDWFELMFGTKQQIDVTSDFYKTKLCKDLKKWLNIESPARTATKETTHVNPVAEGKPHIYGENYVVDLRTLKFNMIRVEGGELEIGATCEQVDDAEDNEHPAHKVNVKTFYIGQFPVTQDVWEIVMGYNKSHFKEHHNSPIKDRFKFLNKAHFPVENISHDEALEFVRRLSEMTNIQFVLPTEEEWEYAARGGQKSGRFKYAGSNIIDKVAWYRGNSDRKTHPVGEKQPNELGLYDMSGNVWEWTETPAHSYASDVEPSGTIFIRRGGSWWHEAKNCRVSRRYASDHTKKTSGLGLRVVIRENIE